MPKEKQFKRRVRARMDRTGERYTTARASVGGRRGTAPKGDPRILIAQPGLVTAYRPADWVWEALAGAGIDYVYGLPRGAGTGAPTPDRVQEPQDIATRATREGATAVVVILGAGTAVFVPEVRDLLSVQAPSIPLACASVPASPELMSYLERDDPRHVAFYRQARASSDRAIERLVAAGIPVFAESGADALLAWCQPHGAT